MDPTRLSFLSPPLPTTLNYDKTKYKVVYLEVWILQLKILKVFKFMQEDLCELNEV